MQIIIIQKEYNIKLSYDNITEEPMLVNTMVKSNLYTIEDDCKENDGCFLCRLKYLKYMENLDYNQIYHIFGDILPFREYDDEVEKLDILMITILTKPEYRYDLYVK